MYIVTIINSETLEILEAPYDTKEAACRAASIALFASEYDDHIDIKVMHDGVDVFE